MLGTGYVGVIMDGRWCPGDLLVGSGSDGGLVGGAGLGVDEAEILGSFGDVSCTQGASSLVVAHCTLPIEGCLCGGFIVLATKLLSTA